MIFPEIWLMLVLLPKKGCKSRWKPVSGEERALPRGTSSEVEWSFSRLWLRRGSLLEKDALTPVPQSGLQSIEPTTIRTGQWDLVLQAVGCGL